MGYRLGRLTLLRSATLLVGAFALIPVARHGAARPLRRAEEPRPNYLNIQPGVDYLGPARESAEAGNGL
jgi:hypothetical protein